MTFSVARFGNELRYVIENMVDPRLSTCFGIKDLSRPESETLFLNAYEMETWLNNSNDQVGVIFESAYAADGIIAQGKKQEAYNERPDDLPEFLGAIKRDDMVRYVLKYFNETDSSLGEWARGLTVASWFNNDFIISTKQTNIWDKAICELAICGVTKGSLNLKLALKQLKPILQGQSQALKDQLLREINDLPIMKIRNFHRIIVAHEIAAGKNGEAFTFFNALHAIGWTLPISIENLLLVTLKNL